MPVRQEWTAHKFPVGNHPGWSQNIISRIEDTGFRIAQHCESLSEEHLSQRLDNGWSIKEHIGHLIDLEAIFAHRFEELVAKKTILFGADMSNAKTDSANHNEKSLLDLLTALGQVRHQLIAQYLLISEEVHNHEALHPRIKVLMKPVDLLFFIAEHDDHHITSIKNIKKQLQG